MKLLLFIMLALSGCTGGDFGRLPGQDLAEKTVWYNSFQELGSPPPVEWFETSDGVLFTVGSHPYTGLTLPGWKIQVAFINEIEINSNREKEDRSISYSSFVHEMLHYHLYLKIGDVDVSHSKDEWGTLFFDATDALWKAGL